MSVSSEVSQYGMSLQINLHINIENISTFTYVLYVSLNVELHHVVNWNYLEPFKCSHILHR